MPSRFTELAPAITTAQSSVVRARDAISGHEIALKRPLLGDARSMACLRCEIEVLSFTQHPNLVKLISSGEDEQGIFIATEWHPGESLDSWIGGTEPLHAAAFLSLFSALLNAVVALHHAGYAHGDLTAANVLITVSPRLLPGSLCLIDLGNATRLAPEHARSIGTPRGSLFSMAPELFEGHHSDALTDLYALGVLGYYMLTSTLPFQGDSKAQVIAAHARHWCKPLNELRPDLPTQLLDWVEWFMARKREDRPTDLAAAIASMPSV